LKDRGISVDDLKSDLRRQQSITKLMNREVVAKISISDQDIADFYASNKQQFNVAEPQIPRRANRRDAAQGTRRSAIAKTTMPPTKPKSAAK